jgi:hypothetical protein
MGTPWFSLRGAHELVVERNGSCLQFWQWSANDQCTKKWASLCFLTWEGGSNILETYVWCTEMLMFLEMVLVYCCFLSFKTRDNLTLRMANEDLSLHHFADLCLVN